MDTKIKKAFKRQAAMAEEAKPQSKRATEGDLQWSPESIDKKWEAERAMDLLAGAKARVEQGAWSLTD